MAINWDQEVLSDMMSSDIFGENIQPTYMPAAGGAFPIDGVFDTPFLKVNLDNDGAPGFTTADPVLGVRLSQFPSLPLAGDRVQISVQPIPDGPITPTLYFVNEVQPDGHGWAELQLTLSG